jgi:hypothetical protein
MRKMSSGLWSRADRGPVDLPDVHFPHVDRGTVLTDRRTAIRINFHGE